MVDAVIGCVPIIFLALQLRHTSLVPLLTTFFTAYCVSVMPCSCTSRTQADIMCGGYIAARSPRYHAASTNSLGPDRDYYHWPHSH
jgi:hypothetical protein